MALTYSLKYRKLNFFQKVLLEKEGEIIVDRQSFRLKGKGAQDQGENIYFGDIREMSIKDDQLSFLTYTKERYVLSSFANLFDSFLKDFMRVRNEYMAESLFMKVGMMYHEYEGHVEIVNNFGKIINKGKSRIQFYEGSIVVIPEVRECFVVYLDFLKSHEFDEDEYVLRLYPDNGNTINISKLGTTYEDAQQTLESLMGKMYERIINHLKEVLPDLDEATLLKLAYKMKGGKALKFNTLKKIHDDLPARLLDLVFKNNPAAEEKVGAIRRAGGEENFYLGFSFGTRIDNHELVVKSWFICAIPEKNLVAVGLTGGSQDNNIYFFRIIMQQGSALEKLPAKILEIDQCMVIFRGDLASIQKDRRELRKSRYKTALKKLSFFRLLRKSFLTRVPVADQVKAGPAKSDLKSGAKGGIEKGGAKFEEFLEKIFERALTFQPEVIAPVNKTAQHPEIIRPAPKPPALPDVGKPVETNESGTAEFPL